MVTAGVRGESLGSCTPTEGHSARLKRSWIFIRQNPLGIAHVQVTTAGGGAGQAGQHGHVGESMHEACFRGVDNGEEIRGVIRECVR